MVHPILLFFQLYLILLINDRIFFNWLCETIIILAPECSIRKRISEGSANFTDNGTLIAPIYKHSQFAETPIHFGLLIAKQVCRPY